MLSGIDLFRATGDRMRYLEERQTVIARNIANSDTPGFKAQDLTPFTPIAPSDASSGVTLVQTNPAHLQTETGNEGSAQTVDSNAAYGGEKPNGNTVSVEEQMVKSADVANAFAMASAVYAKSVSIMKIAVDAGR
jgi:flagellar basal-body rod protein FlgB